MIGFKLVIKMDENSVNVNVKCSFCGKEIECPKNVLEKSKKHICYDCFSEMSKNGSKEDLKDVHVDFPPEVLIEQTSSKMVNQMVAAVFPLMWSERKREFKEMSKKDLAHEMFGAGAYIALSNVMKIQHEQGMKDKEKEK